MVNQETKTLKKLGSLVKKKTPTLGMLILGPAPYGGKYEFFENIGFIVGKTTNYGTRFQRRK